MAVDLSKEKELDVNPKATQKIQFVEQLKKLGEDGNATDWDNDEYMFVLTI